ncbi:hypothetical protein J2S74_002881 [Evansella vedderi]|uniref:Uncharacterized protein n=1 Tax=Evansella vedderi TaxID=38282 RepID=A0ABT9ZW99_9BACI|nr:hypothetical protein [Evansella vedderi]MDQ0255499.1 hypothetical protein [Evansella vedderi]
MVDGEAKAKREKQIEQFRNNCNTLLGKLRKKGWIQNEKLSNNKQHIYYLTEEGLIKWQEKNDIEKNQTGSGYGDDHGYFKYENYFPPKDRFEHHTLLIDTYYLLSEIEKELNEDEFLKQRLGNVQIQMRDNRYAAAKYEDTNTDLIGTKTNIKRFRPDGELLLTITTQNPKGKTVVVRKNYFLEFDTGEERGNKLQTKFVNYDSYFKHLVDNNRPLPEGIIFLRENKVRLSGYVTRWQNISEPFSNTMKEWSTKVNLLYGMMKDLKDIVIQEASLEVNERAILSTRILKYYLESKNYIKYASTGEPFKFASADLDLKWDDAMFSITHSEQDKHHIFLYQRLNTYETRSIERVVEFNKWLRSNSRPEIEELNFVEEVIPVFYHTLDNTVDLSFLNAFDDNGDYIKYLKSSIFVNIQDERNPIWTDVNGNRLKHGNPLLIKVPNQAKV